MVGRLFLRFVFEFVIPEHIYFSFGAWWIGIVGTHKIARPSYEKVYRVPSLGF